jgi:hypothetical protein
MDDVFSLAPQHGFVTDDRFLSRKRETTFPPLCRLALTPSAAPLCDKSQFMHRKS